MAGKAKAISQIKQLLRLHKQGESIKSIGRSLYISENTVKSYLDKLEQLISFLKSFLKLNCLYWTIFV